MVVRHPRTYATSCTPPTCICNAGVCVRVRANCRMGRFYGERRRILASSSSSLNEPNWVRDRGIFQDGCERSETGYVCKCDSQTSRKVRHKILEMRGMVNVPSARKRVGITACLTSVAKCEKCGVLSCARVTLIPPRWQIYSGKIYLSLHRKVPLRWHFSEGRGGGGREADARWTFFEVFETLRYSSVTWLH